MDASRAVHVSTLVGLFASGVLSGFVLSGAAATGRSQSSAHVGMQTAIDELIAS
jgi:hypothetical protein